MTTENLQLPTLPSNICPKHQTEKFVFWCRTCSIFICSMCKSPGHEDHIYTKIEIEASEKAKEQQSWFTKTASMLNQEIERTSDLMKNDEDSITEKITRTFDMIRSLIAHHEKQFKEKVLNMEKQKKLAFENIYKKLRNKQEKVNKRNKELENIISMKDDISLIRDHQKTISYLKTSIQNLSDLKYPIKAQYHINGIDELQCSISDLLQNLSIDESIQAINNNIKSHFDELEKRKISPAKNPDTDRRCPPMRGTSSADIPLNAKWYSKRITVAGGNNQGRRVNQLSSPSGLFVDDDGTMYIADLNNHRILKWKAGAKRGIIVAGGNGKGSGVHQLNRPYDVILDKKNDSIIISDNGNLRVVRWSCGHRTTRGEVLIENIACAGLTMDEDGYLYVADEGKHEVRRYRPGESEGTLVAGGNGKGHRSDQLCEPWYIFLDHDHSLYISDWGNHRVVKWERNATRGIVVAGGNGKGNSLSHLPSPEGICVDQSGTVYVADSWNDRVLCWPQGAEQGIAIIGRHRLSCPIGLSFDTQSNLYIVDWGNHRIQRFTPQ